MLNSFFGISSIESLDQGWQDVRLFSDQSLQNYETVSVNENYSTIEENVLLAHDSDPLGLLSDDAFKTVLLANGNSKTLRITSSHFSDVLYLIKCHNSASFDELFVKGRSQLRESLETKPFKFKSLVQENFDRFVQALSNVLSVFGDMQGRGLTMPNHYGTKRSTDTLSLAHLQAREIYNFQINRSDEENALRSRIDFLMHFENLFKLESILREALKVNIFDKKLVDLVNSAYAELKSSKLSSFFQNELKEYYWTKHIIPLILKIIEQLKFRIFEATHTANDQFQDIKSITEFENIEEINKTFFINEVFLDKLIEHLKITTLNEIQKIL